MTYNQVLSTIRTLLESHAQIKSVKYATPKEWLFVNDQPTYPIACFAINSGSLNIGREQVYNVSLWFLDKAGMEAEFEPDVASDQLQIAADIISKMRNGANNYILDTNISYNFILDKFEDYLSGIEITFNMTTVSEFDACDMPLN
jgi:hypothetical protein